MGQSYTDVEKLALNDEHILAAHARVKASVERGDQEKDYTAADDLP